MKKRWTIEVDITEDDRVPQDEYEDDVFVAEMDYWTDIIETAISNLQYQYRKQYDKYNGAVCFSAIDFTEISIARS